MDILQQSTQKEIYDGAPTPLGATIRSDGVNFAIFSQYATRVFLLLFDKPDAPATDIIELKRKENLWHIYVKNIKAGQLYSYKVEGPYNPAHGHRFNPYKLLLDPYAKAISGKFIDKDHLLFGYDVLSQDRDMVMDQRDNTLVTPKSIIIDDGFDWQGDRPPGIPMDELIIYEVHIKGFTAHASSGVKYPGTYLGFIEKIPYLKQLGINAVELMPVHEFYIRNELVEKGLTDFWGYNSIGFFAPESSYSSKQYPGCQVEEFKTMVRELHKAGIEVIIDVVYNHTGEGNELGPTLCFKGIDNAAYYALAANSQNPDTEPYRFYRNDTGCGNTSDIEHPVVMDLVLDSLRYWREVMHVDGFRFDLASILAKVQGEFNHDSVFFQAISNDPLLSKVKMIAEPWDLNSYHVGNFPAGWSEWNDKFRNTTRKFIKGDEGQAPDMARRLTGSADLYQNDGRKPYNSINFITCHDGFTLYDLYSYNEKHNEANAENNQDGVNDNHSWNCGVEGETQDFLVLSLRKQMIKNAISCLMFSSGTPMLLYGDELMRTQKGNNNVYCQDNELTWLNWEVIKKNAEIWEFVSKAIAFRKGCSILKPRHFFTGEPHEVEHVPDISWHTKHTKRPYWDNPRLKTLCYQLSGHLDSQAKPYYLFFVFNMNYRGGVVELPQHAANKWYRLVDTSQGQGEDFRSYDKKKLLRNQLKHHCAARSVNVFWGE